MQRPRFLRAGAALFLGLVILGADAAASEATTGPGDHTQPVGTLIVLNKSDATAWLIDGATGDRRAELPTGRGPHEVAVSPDGKTAVVSDYGEQSPGRSLTVIDVASAEVVKTIDLGSYRRPHGVQFTADGEHVAVTCEQNNSLLLVDVEAGEVASVVDTAQPASHMVVLAPDQPRAFVANIGPGTVSVVNTESGELEDVVETGRGAEGLDVTPDGKEVWVGNRAEDTVTVLDAHSLEVLATLESATFPIRVKVTPDGSKVLVSNAESGDLAVFDRHTRKELGRIPMAEAQTDDEGRMFSDFEGAVPIGILMHPRSEVAWVANTNADIVSVIDLKTMKVAARIPTGKQPDGLGWSTVTVTAP